MNEKLWEAKKIRDAIVHPQTGEKIFAPFRMSGFVPMNLPIAAGMLMSKSQFWGLFWQWYNQSYNGQISKYVHTYYFIPQKKICSTYFPKICTIFGLKKTQAYGIAVSTSMGVSYALNRFLANSGHLSNTTRTILKGTIPYTAVATAGALNVVVMRFNEIQQGVDVTDKDGVVKGSSKIAGRKAVLETAFSRVILPIPILLFPGVKIEAMSFVKARPFLVTPLNLCVITFFLWGALPAACGLFPQRASIHAHQLEPEFQNMGVDTFWYNRGFSTKKEQIYCKFKLDIRFLHDPVNIVTTKYKE
ncbi:sideroflexin-5-like protein [Reticulomyxa filosa]|uniref:Sideroflexin-5-like protein n=1 Tax=Reticulomyxa filosa TaxID=46433 RepID=X6PDY7_RETFI|nr:sideroflexin-5-like protein [Reticulomyxa filosa]|eukprot:ETO36323.1 sideroflexin-5-like protein [Reticulomyxa filosa]